MKIEVEIRSFISQEKYQELLEFFNQNGNLVKEDDQETYYFDSDQDLRIQRSRLGGKIWLKKGKLHDEAREEIEVKFPRDQFEKAEELFLALGFKVEIKWFRHRFQFEWEGIKVCLDYTQNYGYIIELEKLSDEKGKEKEYNLLTQKLGSLGVDLTPKEEFERRFLEYKKNCNFEKEEF